MSKTKGELTLDDSPRSYCHITTRTELSAADVVAKARERCDEEILVAQLKSAVDAMQVPLRCFDSLTTLRPGETSCESNGNAAVEPAIQGGCACRRPGSANRVDGPAPWPEAHRLSAA